MVDLEQGLGGPTEWAFNLHRDRLLRKVIISKKWEGEKPGEGTESTFALNLAQMQRMRLRDLQAALIDEVFTLYQAGWKESDKPAVAVGGGACRRGDSLREYVQALQDYEYMQKFNNSKNDPFFLTGKFKVGREAFNRARVGHEPVDVGLTDYFELRAPTGDEPVMLPRDRFASIGGRRRAVTAVISGLWLLVPMWIMVLHRTLWSGLVTGTVFVLAFGLCAAVYLDHEKDVVASTAAYAAVLVVFVSINTGLAP